MSLIDSGDGTYTDPETGEMFDIPAGTDRCLALARALFEAAKGARFLCLN